MSAAPEDTGGERVRVAGDVERPDRILAGLSARQLAILAVPAVVLWAAYLATRRVVPLPVFAALAAPIAVAATTLALGRRDGLSLDRFCAFALRHLASARLLVPAPDGVPPVPAALGSKNAKKAAPLEPAPLRLPLHHLGDDGLIDLGPDGAAVVCQASAPSFVLRSPAERRAMVGVFGRWLNGLSAPAQIVVRSVPVDLAPQLAALREAAGGLPHRLLEAAALDHAAFLEGLLSSRQVLSRQVLVVLRDQASDTEALGRLRRAAADAAAALAPAGIALTQLTSEAAQAVLRSALDPHAGPSPTGVAHLDAVVTARGPADNSRKEALR
jgi:hypothetical protein